MARRKRRSDEAPGWVWMLFGLGIGLIIALGVYMNDRPQVEAQSAAVVSETPPIEPTPVEPEPAIETVVVTVQQPEPQAQSTDTPQKTADGEDPNRFGFFEMLPNFEVVIPEVETPERRTPQISAIAEPGIYELQAGSFRTESEADAQRARLALLGIESRLQRVAIDDQTFHRVRIGPIDELDTLNSVRARLTESGIESLLMRMNR